jgi:anaerobic selenocysteine-containing dehydrogenase
MQRVHHRTCHLCEAMCGIRIHLDGGAITRIEGDPKDPLSRGHICPKAVALQDLHTDPDRLRQPVIRDGSRFRAVDWDEALDFAAEGLDRVRRAHGKDAVAVYQGNPTVHNYGNVLFGMQLVRALGTKNRFSATSVDQLPHHFVGYHCLGHQLLLPIPDLDRTDFLLMLGANPAASNGSLMSAGDVKARLKGIGERGGRFVLFDPRRTETARLASEHCFIQPGTDALFLASMLQVVFERRWQRPGALPLTGLEAVQAAVQAFTPERTAPVTGVPAETVVSLAKALAETPRAVVYGRMGTSTQAFGATCQWLIFVLNAVTNHLDTPGGAMFTTPAVDIVAGVFGMEKPGSHGRWHSRVRGIAEVGGELPVAVLAEEITTPGDGQIRALLTMAGNPVLSTPAGSALGDALAGLDFMVSLDPYLNETTRYAHVILPPASPLTRDHYDLVFHALAVRNTAKWSPPMVPRPASERHDWEVMLGLEERLQTRRGLATWAERTARGRLGPSGVLDLALRTGPHGGWFGMRGLSLAKLEAAPHGVDLGPLEPRLPERLRTEDRTVHLAPTVFLDDLPRLEAALEPAAADRAFRLIGRRDLRSNNSWMHNSARLVKGKNRCTLWMHPDDADTVGLVEGALARVESRVGAVEVPVHRTDAMMVGVVCLPHGWGHGRQGVRLGVASAHAGVSMNDLTDPESLDNVCGNAVLNGTPVDVSPVGAPAGLSASESAETGRLRASAAAVGG